MNWKKFLLFLSRLIGLFTMIVKKHNKKPPVDNV